LVPLHFCFIFWSSKHVCESLKWLKGAKPGDLEDVLLIWIGKLNMKTGTATDEVIKEQGKVLGQQTATNSDMYFAPKK
jgi:hypothetical protein